MLGQWQTKEWVIFAIPFVLVLLGVGAWLLMRKTIRTRLRTGKALRDDPDINEWLVVFGWSRKVLYVPTILASLAAFVAMLFLPEGGTGARIVGGCWLGVFALNFLIDEYELSVKVLLIGLLVLVLAALWLVGLDWWRPVLRAFRHLGFSMSWAGYLALAVLFTLAVAISWVHGLFYYVAITPNYLNVQVGPTETGEQVAREEYSTRVDTGDFLERLLGFGRIIITFADQRRQPMMLLVGRIGRKAARLESIRGKLAWDRHQPGREGAVSDY